MIKRHYSEKLGLTSLNDLEILVEPWDGEVISDQTFVLKGLSITGASWEGGALVLSNTIRSNFGKILCYCRQHNANEDKDGWIDLPIFKEGESESPLLKVLVRTDNLSPTQLRDNSVRLIAENYL